MAASRPLPGQSITVPRTAPRAARLAAKARCPDQPRHVVACRLAVQPADQVQRQVVRQAHSAAGDRTAGVDNLCRCRLGSQRGQQCQRGLGLGADRGSPRRRLAPVEQPGGGQDQRTGADRGEPRGIQSAQERQHRRVADWALHPGPPVTTTASQAASPGGVGSDEPGAARGAHPAAPRKVPRGCPVRHIGEAVGGEHRQSAGTADRPGAFGDRHCRQRGQQCDSPC